MPGEIDRNQIDSEGRGRSTSKGDVPDPLRRRYYLDERGGPGLGFYADARIQTATFRDLGARLVTPRSDPNAIRDMAAIAHHRGWTVVVVHGEADFRREAWLTAMAIGIEVKGYRANERDLQELERRQVAAQRRAERAVTHPTHAAERPDGEVGQANMRVVEAVVRARVVRPIDQERILAAARRRIAGWLERGASLEKLTVKPSPERDIARPLERQRGR